MCLPRRIQTSTQLGTGTGATAGRFDGAFPVPIIILPVPAPLAASAKRSERISTRTDAIRRRFRTMAPDASNGNVAPDLFPAREYTPFTAIPVRIKRLERLLIKVQEPTSSLQPTWSPPVLRSARHMHGRPDARPSAVRGASVAPVRGYNSPTWWKAEGVNIARKALRCRFDQVDLADDSDRY